MKQSYIADMVLSLKDKFAAVAWQGKARKIAYLSLLGSRPSNNAAIRARDPLWRKCNGRCTHLPTWFAARYIHYRMDDRARGHLVKLDISIIMGHTLKKCHVWLYGMVRESNANLIKKKKKNITPIYARGHWFSNIVYLSEEIVSSLTRHIALPNQYALSNSRRT